MVMTLNVNENELNLTVAEAELISKMARADGMFSALFVTVEAAPLTSIEEVNWTFMFSAVCAVEVLSI